MYEYLIDLWPAQDGVMIRFMPQLEWAMGCPDIQLNIILGRVYRVFLDEINTGIGRLSKDCSFHSGGASTNSGRPELNKKTE